MSEEIDTKECPFCAENIKINAKICKHCGKTVDIVLKETEDAKAAQAPQENFPNQDPPKQRIIYIIFALLVGSFGAHNFYAGRNGIAMAQLGIFILSFFLIFVFIGIFLIFIPPIWAVIEAIVVTKDGKGRTMV